jgi:hypothetical protein
VKRWGKSPPASVATRRLAKPRPVQGEQVPLTRPAEEPGSCTDGWSPSTKSGLQACYGKPSQTRGFSICRQPGKSSYEAVMALHRRYAGTARRGRPACRPKAVPASLHVAAKTVPAGLGSLKTPNAATAARSDSTRTSTRRGRALPERHRSVRRRPRSPRSPRIGAAHRRWTSADAGTAVRRRR